MVDKVKYKVYNSKLLNHGFMCLFHQKQYSTCVEKMQEKSEKTRFFTRENLSEKYSNPPAKRDFRG